MRVAIAAHQNGEPRAGIRFETGQLLRPRKPVDGFSSNRPGGRLPLSAMLPCHMVEVLGQLIGAGFAIVLYVILLAVCAGATWGLWSLGSRWWAQGNRVLAVLAYAVMVPCALATIPLAMPIVCYSPY